MFYIKCAIFYGCLSVSITACVDAPVRSASQVPPVRTVQKHFVTYPALPAASRAPKTVWQQLPAWQTVNLLPSWQAFRSSCRVLRHKSAWKNACVRADKVNHPDNGQVRSFFEAEFMPRQLTNHDGSSMGLVTGYYEPKLNGSSVKTARFRYPLYAAPTRLTGSKSPFLPDAQRKYYSRADIKAGKANLSGHELYWVENEVDLFFLQIQGSGRIALPNGQLVKVSHAAHNGHPYYSVGQKLVNMGELTADQASMWDIKAWGAQHPEKLLGLLNSNPRYVFFRELPDSYTAPVGALGVPLTEGYSIAVDPKNVPLGAPIFLSTTYPNSPNILNRLVFAQDTGIAIKGNVRADLFWGFGSYAETQASRMKQKGKMWVLLPRKAVRGRQDAALVKN